MLIQPNFITLSTYLSYFHILLLIFTNQLSTVIPDVLEVQKVIKFDQSHSDVSDKGKIQVGLI